MTASAVEWKHRLSGKIGSQGPPDWYGAGLAGYIGKPAAAKTIEAIVRSQLTLESAVAARPTPAVTVTSYATGVMAVTISYFNTNIGAMRTLSFNVNQ